MWAFLSFFSIILQAMGEAPPCPPHDDVSPCYCDTDRILTSVNCKATRLVPDVETVVRNTLPYNVSFGLWRTVFGDIPSDFFNGHQSVNLHFENCKINSFGDRPFTGLENYLENLFIYGSVDKNRKDLTTFRLGHLKKLKDLSFLANDIGKLENDWFEEGPEALIQLDLEANDIEELGDRAFASLINVEQIWLGDNSFKTVSRSMFPNPANKLWLLEMSFNGISELPSDMFEGFPALKTVNIMGNQIKTLPEAIWGNIWGQLEEVYLERMVGFACTDEIKWIYRQELPRRFSGKCASGNDMYGKELAKLTLEDFK